MCIVTSYKYVGFFFYFKDLMHTNKKKGQNKIKQYHKHIPLVQLYVLLRMDQKIQSSLRGCYSQSWSYIDLQEYELHSPNNSLIHSEHFAPVSILHLGNLLSLGHFLWLRCSLDFNSINIIPVLFLSNS